MFKAFLSHPRLHHTCICILMGGVGELFFVLRDHDEGLGWDPKWDHWWVMGEGNIFGGNVDGGIFAIGVDGASCNFFVEFNVMGPKF